MLSTFPTNGSQYTLNNSPLTNKQANKQTHVMASTIMQVRPIQSLCMSEFSDLVNEIPHIELDGEVIAT